MQQKLVLQLDVHDDLNCKQKAIKLVSSIPGIDSISMDIKAKKLTLIGDMDPIAVVKKLRKTYQSQIISVGPAKEPEKPKEKPKEPAEPKPGVPVIEYVHRMQVPYFRSNTYYVDPCYYHGYPKIVEEDPAGCVIC